MIRTSYLYILLVFCSCQSASDSEKESKNESISSSVAKDHHSANLTMLFNAHGGYDRWSEMKSLSYQKGDEHTIVNLQNRKIRLQSPSQTIGFDGENVWVTPDSVDASRARFYHNLYFYFYAMPFVVGDPGASYENMEPRQILNKTYHGIKVSYGEGVGDSPDDNYILWYDPANGRMEWLMYTVTYRSGEPTDKYNLIRYSGWVDINGLILPTSLQWYQFDGDTVGDKRGEPALFEKISISTDDPGDSLFDMPANAQIAPR